MNTDQYIKDITEQHYQATATLKQLKDQLKAMMFDHARHGLSYELQRKMEDVRKHIDAVKKQIADLELELDQATRNTKNKTTYE